MANEEEHLEKNYERNESIFEKQCDGKDVKPSSYGLGVRHLQCLIIFFTLCITLISRSHLSATIVAMTDIRKPMKVLVEPLNIPIPVYNGSPKILNETSKTPQYKEEENIEDDKEFDFSKNVSECDINEINATCEIHNTTSSIWNVYRVYDWPKSTQEMILGSFFFGYMLMMSPMGLVCQRWGGKLPLQISLFSTAAITFFTPWLTALGGYKALSFSRVALGLTQAGVFPSINLLMSKWVPVNERGRLASTVFIGSSFGSILAGQISGLLAVSRFGWPSIFWVIGMLCFFMFSLLTWIVTNSPQQNRFISEEEKCYILGEGKNQTEKRYPTPWKAIFTSKPVWASFCAHFGGGFGFIFLFSEIPTYLHHVIGLNVKNSGLLSSLPYVGNLVMSIIIGIGSDYVINKKIMTTKQVRIASNSMGTLGPAVTLIALSFITSPVLAVSCLMLCMACQAGMHTGFMLNYMDLAPKFSGAMMATGNTFLNFGVLILPVLVSQIVVDMSDINQWRIMLFIVSGVAIFFNTINMIFTSVEIQPWNTPSYETAEQEDPDLAEK